MMDVNNKLACETRAWPWARIFAAFLISAMLNCSYADTKNVRLLRTIEAPYDINYIAWNPNSEELAGGGTFNNAVTIWNARTGDVVREISDPGGGVASLAYSPDGRYLAVGREFTRLTKEHVHLGVYDAKTGAVVQRFAPETPPSGTSNDVSAVAFSPDGRYVVASAYVGDRSTVVYDMRVGKVVALLPSGAGNHINASLAYSPDGRYIVIGKYGGTIDVISTTDWSLRASFTAHETAVHALAFCGSSRFIVTGSYAVSAHYETGTNKRLDRYVDPIKLWDMDAYSTVRAFQSELNGSVQSISCTADGSVLFAANGGKSAEIWDVQKNIRLEWLKDYEPTTFVQPAANSKRFAIAAKKKVEIWEPIR